MIVLDTNVVSELMRAARAPAVDAWFSGRDHTGMFITATSEAELLYGLAALRDGRRKSELIAALQVFLDRGFHERILPFDRRAAAAYADIAAASRRNGHSLPIVDMQIGAIAVARGAQAIATRNTAGFIGCGIPVVDPWEAD